MTLTEEERATVMRIGEKHNWPGGYMQHDFAALLAIIDRLSAAPVDDRAREGEVLLLDGKRWRVRSQVHGNLPGERIVRLVPVSPSVDPEEG